jgi:cysteine desulfurase / selenocysteine lyase
MSLLARFGMAVSFRAPFAMYSTRDEIDYLAQALLKAQDFLS